MRSNVTILLSSGRSVTGSLERGQQRLSDALNGTLMSVLPVSEAILGRFGNPAANEPVSVAVVPKHHVVLVIEHDFVRSANEKRMYSYVPKLTSQLIILLAGLRVRGDAYGAAQIDEAQLHRQLAERRDHFMVLTDAWLAFDVEGNTERSVGTTMLNSRHVQFVARVQAAAELDPRLRLVAAQPA